MRVALCTILYLTNKVALFPCSCRMTHYTDSEFLARFFPAAAAGDESDGEDEQIDDEANRGGEEADDPDDPSGGGEETDDLGVGEEADDVGRGEAENHAIRDNEGAPFSSRPTELPLPAELRDLIRIFIQRGPWKKLRKWLDDHR